MTVRSLARLLLGLVLLASAGASAQSVAFTSSNLPIVVLDTDGAAIPDEPKITARMQIIDNGSGARNALTDAPTGYDGAIGIEVRGQTSQSFPKKQYALETRDAAGENLNVSLLGMPAENDWVLQAPYSDKSLMRNVLAYDLSRRLGRYAARVRFCEVVLNGDYQGVYVLMESIKRDKNRVAINALKEDETTGDDLSGGYLLRIGKLDGTPGEAWTSPYPPGYPTSGTVKYQYREPDADDIVSEQAAYIQSFVETLESAMDSDAFADLSTGYPSIVDVSSFVDFFLVQELGKNIDGYRISSYLHKDKDSVDPRFRAGPVWDFNLAFGNANYSGGDSPEAYQVNATFSGFYPIPFWWPKMAQSEPFQTALDARWRALRATAFSDDSLAARVDSAAALLDEAQARNFERWPVLGTYVWPNADGFEARTTYASEVAYLKTWLLERTAWIDGSALLAGGGETTGEAGLSLRLGPNPARAQVTLAVTVATPGVVAVEVFDVRGRHVAQVFDGVVAETAHVALDASTLSPGVYLVRARSEAGAATQRLVVAGR